MRPTTNSRPANEPTAATPPRPVFVTTRWSLVLSAGCAEEGQGQAALTNLCQTYWYPLYAYVRGRGYVREDAQDLTQAFFARLLEKNWIASADREKGRFRTFLLTALKRFLCDEWDKARAQKRGGRVTLLPLEFETAETRWGREPASAELNPEQSFERRWVFALLDEVLKRLREEFAREGNAGLFAELAPALVDGGASLAYAEIGRKLGLSESAIKSAAHRLRQRYRTLLRSEIAETVASPAEVDEELRHLFAVLGRQA